MSSGDGPRNTPGWQKKDQTHTIKNDFLSLAPEVSGLGGPTLHLSTGRRRIKVPAWVTRGISRAGPAIHPHVA